MIKKNKRIVFRADGSTQSGLGHVVRCSAVADMIGDGWEKILFTRCAIPNVLSGLEKHFSSVNSIGEEVEFLSEAAFLRQALLPSDIVVLDGYHFKGGYQTEISSVGCTIVCIDDIHSYFFNSSIVINSAGGVTPLDYKSLPGTQFYLGPKYTLLRKPFLMKALVRQNKIVNRNVFICLGGADPDNKTLEVVRQIIAINRFEHFNIVIGAGYLYGEELRKFISNQKMSFDLHNSISAVEMAEIMDSCSYAVCSPSTVSYEYMTVGGVLYLTQIAENQSDMINYLTKEGFAFLLKDVAKNNQEDEEKSLLKQAAIFDGKAGERLQQIFDKLSFAKEITIRKANAEDSMLLLNWANDKEVREQSYNTSAILPADHEKWYNEKLTDRDSFIYLLTLDERQIAQIRFQVKEGKAILGYLVDKEFRRKGIGTTILSKGVEAFTNEFSKRIAIVGFVKFSNIASQRSFEKLRFQKEEANEYESSFKYTMQYEGH